MLAVFVIVLVLVFQTVVVEGHGRWKCPPPRDALDENGQHITFDNTGNKVGACGPESGKWGFGKVTSLSPGWHTLLWEESISHTGSPFRLAILDATETARIILLDHIPHNEDSNINYQDESSFLPYKISVNIPDIQCTKCSLQLLYVMTEKTRGCGIKTCYYNPLDSACKGSTDPNKRTCAGAPNDQVCVQEGECFSNYHSCTDVIITGSKDISSFALDSQPSNWPYKNMTMQYYSKESGVWKDNWLQNVPSDFTTDYGTVGC